MSFYCDICKLDLGCPVLNSTLHSCFYTGYKTALSVACWMWTVSFNISWNITKCQLLYDKWFVFIWITSSSSGFIMHNLVLSTISTWDQGANWNSHPVPRGMGSRWTYSEPRPGIEPRIPGTISLCTLCLVFFCVPIMYGMNRMSRVKSTFRRSSLTYRLHDTKRKVSSLFQQHTS